MESMEQQARCPKCGWEEIVQVFLRDPERTHVRIMGTDEWEQR